MRIELDVDGEEEVLGEFERRESRAGNMRPAFGAVADDFLGIERDIFASEGGYLGHRWPPLSPKWVAQKAKRYPGAGMLELDGRLKRSLTQRGAPYQRRDITRDEVRLGTTLGVARIHQDGATVTINQPNRRSARIPARSFVGLTDRDERRWAGYVERHMAGDRLGGIGL